MTKMANTPNYPQIKFLSHQFTSVRCKAQLEWTQKGKEKLMGVSASIFFESKIASCQI